MTLKVQLKNMNHTYKDVYSLQKQELMVVVQVDMEK